MASSSHLQKVTGQLRQEILNMVTTWTAQHLGKGPVRTNVTFSGSTVTIEMHGMLNAMDKLLAANGREDVVQQYRSAILEVQTEGWSKELYSRFGLKVSRISGSLDLANDVRTVNIHINGWATTK